DGEGWRKGQRIPGSPAREHDEARHEEPARDRQSFGTIAEAQADHQPSTTHRVWAADRLELLAPSLAIRSCALGKMLVANRRDRGEGRGTCGRRAEMRARVNSRTAVPPPRLHDPRAADARRDRMSAPKALPQAQEVRQD